MSENEYAQYEQMITVRENTRAIIMDKTHDKLTPIFRSLGLIRDGEDIFTTLTYENPRYPLGIFKIRLKHIVTKLITIENHEDIKLSENMFTSFVDFIKRFYFRPLLFMKGCSENINMNGVIERVNNTDDVDTFISDVHKLLQQNIDDYLASYQTQVIPNKQTK